MPLDSTRAIRSTAVAEAFAEIGRVDATAPPKRAKEVERLAYEYWVSSALAQAAEQRREKAKKAAVAAGVIPDFTTEPLAIGSAEVIYTGALVTISVKVTAQADKVNAPALVADLIEAGVARPLLKKLLRKHTKTFHGAHVIIASLTE